MASTIGIKLDDQAKLRLKALGEKMDRSAHWIMKTAIEQYLTEQERYWRERQEDEDRWEHYLLTGDAVAHDKVALWLESIGTPAELPCPR